MAIIDTTKKHFLIKTIPYILFITLILFISIIFIGIRDSMASTLVESTCPEIGETCDRSGSAGLCYDRTVTNTFIATSSSYIEHFEFYASNETAELYGYNLWYDDYTITIYNTDTTEVLDAFNWEPTATGTQTILMQNYLPMGNWTIEFVVGSTASSCPSTATTIGLDDTRLNDGYNMYFDTNPWSTYDLIVDFYGSDTYDVSVPDEVAEWYLQYRDAPYPDYIAPITQVCFTDQVCNVWFYYNNLMIGETIRLIDDETDTLVDEVVVPTTYNNEYYLEWPAESVEQNIDYNLFSPVCYEYIVDGVDFGGCGIRKGGFTLQWVASSIYMPDFSIFDEDPCIGITDATSSISYQVNCAMRKFSNWLFKPKNETMLELMNEIDKTTQNFPLNWFVATKSTFDDLVATTSTGYQQESAIPLIFWWNEDTDSLELKASGEITTTTVSTLLTDDVYNRFYGYMVYFLMIIGTLYFIFRILHISFNSQTER